MTAIGSQNQQKSADPTYNYPFDLLRLQPVFKASLFWVNAERIRQGRVARYRAYYDGDHDLPLSPEMKAALRIKDANESMSLNVMPTVVDAKSDRSIVQSIDGIQATGNTQTQSDSEAEDVLKDPRKNPSAWIQELMEANHFDILQGDVHQAAVRDGDTYLILTYDNDKEQVRWTFEEAFDGYSGMLAYYPSRNVPEMAAAVKIWQIDEPGSLSTFQMLTRVNVYYPDRIEKYITQGVGALTPMGDTPQPGQSKEPQFVPYVDAKIENKGAIPGEEHIWPWVDRTGEPLGIPVIHFRNAGRHNYGVSELRNAIGPQNALNRFHYSAIMTAEFTAFSILVARGHPVPETITPGMVWEIAAGGLLNTQTADLTRLAAGDMAPILDVMTNERHLIADITRTPSPDLMGGGSGTKSGEMLKQLEIGLLGKVHAFQNRAGVSWEAVADMSWKIQAAFSTVKPPPYKRFITRWKPAEIRDNAQVVQSAVLMDPIWGNEQTMKEVSGVFDNLDEDTIARIMEEKRLLAAQQQLAALSAQPGTPPAATAFASSSDTAKPGTGKVAVAAPPVTIAATGDTAQATPNGAAPTANKPAVRGNKLPSGEARKVTPISDTELQLVGTFHRNKFGVGAKTG